MYHATMYSDIQLVGLSSYQADEYIIQQKARSSTHSISASRRGCKAVCHGGLVNIIIQLATVCGKPLIGKNIS